MSFKNVILKTIAKLENFKIKPKTGYLLITLSFLTICAGIIFDFLNVMVFKIQNISALISYFIFFSFLVLILLIIFTKRVKKYGNKISRFFSLLFIIFTGILETIIMKILPSEDPKWYGDCLITSPSYTWIFEIILIVAGFLGYFFGKIIAKKIKQCKLDN